MWPQCCCDLLNSLFMGGLGQVPKPLTSGLWEGRTCPGERPCPSHPFLAGSRSLGCERGEPSALELEGISHKQQPNICQALQLQLIILLFFPLFSAFHPLMTYQATQTRGDPWVCGTASHTVEQYQGKEMLPQFLGKRAVALLRRFV